MRPFKVVALLLLAAAPFLFGQHKKKRPSLSAAFEQARYVYVQADDGDIMQPDLYPEDRRAIADVEDGLRKWNRYTLVINRNEADLIIVVRKGRMVGVQGRGGVSAGTQPQGSSYPGHQSPRDQNGYEIGSKTEVGPKNDLLWVYIPNANGERIGPIWRGEMPDGLDGPEPELLRQLKEAVEHAYPKPTQQGRKPKP
jgi:hypothetical protein